MLTAVTFGQGTVEGVVIDATSEEPLPGVNVIVVGTTTGASTNADGEFQITGLSTGVQEIEARFVGYTTVTKEVTVEGGATVEVNFELRQSATNLNEVVITGTGGPVEKKKLGNSIGSINAEDLETNPISNFSEMIQGREPGMVGLPSGGLTGEGSRIRIRGSASLSQSNEPIVLIDGIRVDRGGGFGGFVGTGGGGSPSRLDDINPRAIDRVEILKGAAAATLYGTEASNGVIQIFTKSGSVTDGVPRFDFSSEVGMVQFPKIVPDNVGFARDQAQADRMSSNLGKDVQPYELVHENFLEDLYETGYNVTNSLNISGGNPGITYFIGGRWSKEDGPFGGNNRDYRAGVETLAKDEAQVGQLNANLRLYPTDKFTFNINTRYTDRDFSTVQNNNNIYATGSLAQFSKPELVAENNSTGSPAFSTVNESMQQTVSQRVQHYNGSVDVNYQPLESLSITGQFGVDFTNQFSEEVRPFGWNVDNFASDEIEGARRTSDRNNLNLTGRLRATHTAPLGEDFESTFNAGAEVYSEKTQIASASGVNFPGPDFGVTSAASQQEVFESVLQNTTLGVYGQEQISFREYLHGTVGARLDANSAFGSEFNAVL
jgi:TonB-dependent SusC/RagA subfamily outer membrane receptor